MKHIKKKYALNAGIWAALLGLPSLGHAAGGHHAVDDAAMLEPGQCQLEVWIDQDARRAHRLQHLGPACRLGPVELGLNLDRLHLPGASSSQVGPQLKWAMPLTERLGVGLVLAATWREQAAPRLTRSLLIPLSWQASERWLLHVNLGRDFHRGFHREAPSSSHAGAAVEWSAQPAWTLVAERFRESGAAAWRLGGRWHLSPAFSLDLSRAQGLGAQPPAWWTLGLNLAFER